MTSYFSQWQLHIESKTWTRDYSSLYDYHICDSESQNFNVISSGQLIRKDNVIRFRYLDAEENTKSFDDTSSPLVIISESSEGVKITPVNENDEDRIKDLWEIVGPKENEERLGARINLNDEIKLGKVRLKIIQVKRKGECEGLDDTGLSQSNLSIRKDDTSNDFNENGEPHKEASCRVCLLEQEEDYNPLIVPCSCGEENRYIHLECMRRWISNKMSKVYKRNVIHMRWKLLSCDMCKQTFPESITHKDKELSLLQSDDNMMDSYVMIERFSKKTYLKVIDLIDLSSDQTFTVGRSESCDIEYNLISVSRVHAFLTVSNSNLYLSDNKSKYGSLLLQREPIILNNDMKESPWIQCGRTIFRFSLQPWIRAIAANKESVVGCNKEEKSEKRVSEVLE